MAITTKLLPILPANEGNEAGTIMRFPVSAAQTIKQGDVLYMIAGGTVTRSPATATGAQLNWIVGIAAENKASVATVAATDAVTVWPALPGRVFEGHIVAGATTDSATTATAAALVVATEDNVLIEATDAGGNLVYCVGTAITATLAPVAVLGFADSQPHDTTNYKTGNLAIAAGAVGVLNPRVKFVFRHSAFIPVVPA